jgi:hypothetical protein
MDSIETTQQNGLATNPGKVSLMFGSVVAYEIYQLSQIGSFEIQDFLAGIASSLTCAGIAIAYAKPMLHHLRAKSKLPDQFAPKYLNYFTGVLSAIFIPGCLRFTEWSHISPTFRSYVVASAFWYITFGIAMFAYTWYRAKTKDRN